MRPRPLGIAVLGLTSITHGCDLLVEPGRTVPTTVQFQIEDAEDSSFTAILGSVDRVWLEFERGGAAVDTVAGVRIDGHVIQTRVSLVPPPGPGPLMVHAALRSGPVPLFDGVGVMADGAAPTAEIVLSPIPGYIVTPSQPYHFDALGLGIQLWSEVYFANRQRWYGTEARWTSEDPEIVEVEAGNRAVARSNGAATLVATFQSIERTLAVSVAQVPSTLWDVAPSDTTVFVGDTFQMRAFGEDLNGVPLLPGAAVTWVAEGGVVIDEAGVVTATASGSAFVHAVHDGQSWTAAIVVAAPPPS